MMPIKGYKVSTKFGVKGKMWSSGRHEGVDIAAPTGTEIVAPVDAKVERVGQVWGGAFGHNSVLLKVEGGYLLFAHCSKALVKPGQKVKMGQPIAKVGADGNVTGPHLHMEYQKGPGWVRGGGMDPKKFLDAKPEAKAKEEAPAKAAAPAKPAPAKPAAKPAK